MRPFSLRRALIVMLLLGQLVLYVTAWHRFDYLRSDFAAFYVSAQLWSEGENAYDLQKQCERQANLGRNACLVFAHPPVVLPLVALISTGNLRTSYYRWVLVLILVALVCLWPLHKLSGDTRIAVQSVLFFPVYIGIALGQDSTFILLAILLWVMFLLKGRDFIAGLIVSLSIIKPQIAILLAVPLAFSKWKAFVGFVIGSAILTGFCFLLVGAEGFRGILKITRVMAGGQMFGVDPAAMPNATGLLVRSGLDASLSWAIFIAGVVTLSVLWARKAPIKGLVSLTIIIGAFAAPHLHSHDLGPLVIPSIFVHPLGPAVASLTLLVGFDFGLLPLSAYLLMFCFAFFSLRKFWLTHDP